MSRVYTVLIGVVTVCSVLSAMTFINRVGRRILMVGGEVGLSLILTAIAVVTWVDIGGVFLPLLLIVVFFVVLEWGPGSLNWIYTGEVTTDNIMGLAIASCCLNLSLVIVTFPYLVEYLGISGCFLVYAVVTGGAAIYLGLDMVETHGLTKTQTYAKVTGT